MKKLLLTLLLITSAQARHIVGYYPSWAIYARNYLVTDSYADIDRFYPGDCWDPGCERGNFHQLRILKQQHPNLKTLISVGGWSWSDYFSDVALTPASRELFANSCAEFVIEHGFDGVDLDWEYPDGGGEPGNIERPEDPANYVLLCQRLRAKMDSLETLYSREFLLTMAGATVQHITNNDIVALSSILDFINVMCYDFIGHWSDFTGLNAPLFLDPANPFIEPMHSHFYSSVGIQDYIAAGAPPSKLVLGMPFYGVGFGGVNGGTNGLYGTHTGPSPHGTWQNGFYDHWDIAQNYVGQNGYTRFYHPLCRVPYLWSASAHVFISYDDTASIREKCEYIIDGNLGGAMFWELAADRNGDLLSTVFNTFASSNPLPAPQNLTLTRIGNNLSFRWLPVAGATQYKLWSSVNPLAPPESYTLEITTSSVSTLLPFPFSQERIYFVTAE
jgi:chitinase